MGTTLKFKSDTASAILNILLTPWEFADPSIIHNVHLGVKSLYAIVLRIPVRRAKHKENQCHEDESHER